MAYAGGARYDTLRGERIALSNFKVSVGVLAPRLIWVTGQTVLGGQLALHAVAPLLDVDARIGAGHWKSSGLGDVMLGAALGYHASPNFHYLVALDLYAPTGKYDRNDPSSLGKNIWMAQPVVALSYLQAAGGNAELKLMYDINQRNSATDTRSGQALHADYAVGYGSAMAGWRALAVMCSARSAPTTALLRLARRARSPSGRRSSTTQARACSSPPSCNASMPCATGPRASSCT